MKNKKDLLLVCLILFATSCQNNAINSDTNQDDLSVDSIIETNTPTETSIIESDTQEQDSETSIETQDSETSIETQDSETSIETIESIIESESSLEEQESTTSVVVKEGFYASKDAFVNPFNGDNYLSYYDNVDFDLNGEALKANLNTIIQHKNGSYAALKAAYKLTDYDPYDATHVVLYYTAESRYWDFNDCNKYRVNREHVWPKSHFGGVETATSPYADIFNVRPSDMDENSKRGNLAFDDDAYAPTNQYKGDVARTIFYVATRYSNLSIVDSTSLGSYTMGKLSTLLEWNLNYPVSEMEMRRNTGGQDYQGNRNPFIDNPSFACAIWGETNSTTKNICSKK